MSPRLPACAKSLRAWLAKRKCVEEFRPRTALPQPHLVAVIWSTRTAPFRVAVPRSPGQVRISAKLLLADEEGTELLRLRESRKSRKLTVVNSCAETRHLLLTSWDQNDRSRLGLGVGQQRLVPGMGTRACIVEKDIACRCVCWHALCVAASVFRPDALHWKVAAEAFAPALPAAQGARFYRCSACLPLRMGGGGVSGEGAGTQSFANIRQTRESGPVQPGEAGARTTRYSFAEARKYARSFGFQTEEEYREYKCAGAYSKALLPADPASVFADDWYLHQWSSSVFSASPTLWPQTLTLIRGRTDWGDWLGSMLPFEEARLRVRALNIASEDEWKQMVCGVCARLCVCACVCGDAARMCLYQAFTQVSACMDVFHVRQDARQRSERAHP